MSNNYVSGFYHAGITVKDIEESLNYYCNLLGFELISKQDITADYIFQVVKVDAEMIKVAFLKVPNSDVIIELLEYVGVNRSQAKNEPCDYGSGHICLFVNDLEALFNEFTKKGMKFRSSSPIVSTYGVNKGNKIVYSLDPDGYVIEFIEKK